MPIGALVTLIPQPGAADAVIERLLDVARDVRDEPGNLLTILLRDWPVGARCCCSRSIGIRLP